MTRTREELAWAGGFYNRGHEYDGNRTAYGQCRVCMQLADERRRLKAVV